jgi:hypothetical protein
VAEANEYKRLILEAIEDMEFLATTFNTERGGETERAFKRGQKEACLKWAEILKERLSKLEGSKMNG